MMRADWRGVIAKVNTPSLDNPMLALPNMVAPVDSLPIPIYARLGRRETTVGAVTQVMLDMVRGDVHAEGAITTGLGSPLVAADIVSCGAQISSVMTQDDHDLLVISDWKIRALWIYPKIRGGHASSSAAWPGVGIEIMDVSSG